MSDHTMKSGDTARQAEAKTDRHTSDAKEVALPNSLQIVTFGNAFDNGLEKVALSCSLQI